MDVHPPHEPIHTWRDFFIHLITITVGLLIALSLEGTVEFAHRRHLLHQSENTLQAELSENQATLAGDKKELEKEKKQIEDALRSITDLQNHPNSGDQLNLNWEWNSMQSAAWDTARNTGAVALMPYESAQRYSQIYGQQVLVNEQAFVYIRGIYRTGSVQQGGRKLSNLKPSELDTLTANLQQLLVDLEYLEDLSESLHRTYDRTSKEL